MKPKNISFGRVSRKSEPQTKKITITRGDGGGLALKLLGDTPPSIEAKLNEIEPGERYELEVAFKPALVSERVSTNLRLETGVPEAPAASIRVYATVIPRVSVKPRNVRLPEKRDSNWQRTIQLDWDESGPAKVLEVTIGDPKLSIRLEENEGEQVLVLQALPGYVPRSRKKTITLVTDDPEMPTITTSVSVSGKIVSTRRARKAERKRNTKTKAKKPQAASIKKVGTQKVGTPKASLDE